MRKRAINWLVAGIVMALGTEIATSAKAAYVLRYEEVGTDVVAKGSGSLDLTDLSFVGSGVGSCFGADGLFALACVGPHSIDIDTYRGFLGPLSFGPGTSTFLNFVGIRRLHRHNRANRISRSAWRIRFSRSASW